VANDITIRVTAKDDASRVLDGVDKKAKGLGSTFASVGKIAGGFLAANVIAGAAQKVVGFLTESVKAASDLGESINAVNVIFGKSSQTILDWGKNNATQFGLSQRAFNQLATPLGAMLKNAGLEDFADQTINLTERAADMASVFNTDVASALEAIQAAIRGETDPIERYGVSLSAAAVEARALADGAKLVDGELSNQAKTAARLALIFEQTAAVQGDFANTSGELANAQRIAAARTEELQAQIGEKLIPVMLKLTELKLALVTVIAEKLIPKLEELYAKHWPAVSKAIQDFVAVVEEWWPKLQPIFQVVLEDIIARIQGFIQQLQGIVQMVEGIADLVKAVAEGNWRAAWEALLSITQGYIDVLIGSITQMFGSLPGKLYDAGKEMIQGLIDGVKSKLDELENLFKAITDKIPDLKGPIEKDRRLLEPTGRAIMQGLASGLSTGFNRTVSPYLSGTGGNIAGAVGGGAASALQGAGVGGGGFAFNVTNMNIYEKDDREVKDVAFAVTTTMNNEVRRRGYLLSSSPPTTSTGVKYGRP
jgi:hypothetical protein